MRKLVVVCVLLSACAKTAATDLPPPVAGLWHPQAVRPGQSVLLDAANTAVAKAPASDPGAAGSHAVQFRFEVATFAAVEGPQSQRQWVFEQPGHYALRLTVTDDAGRQDSVLSAIDVVADLADTCTGTTAAGGCASGLCAAGQCAVFACADQPACPVSLAAGLTCDRGFCTLSPVATGTGSTEDAYAGEDVGNVSGADVGTP